MKVLMIGATGHYASLVLPALVQHGVTVRALVRKADAADAVRRQGAAETAVGDLTDAASLRAAAQGVDGVFHLNPAFAPNEADLGVAMVEAAQAAGVRKFVFSSVIHPSLALVNHAAKRPVEAALYDSGLDFTVLQPTMFMQNLAGSWPRVVATGKFALPYSQHAQVCYVDYRDVAEAVALAFTTDRLSRGTFELCAGGQIDSVGLAALMSEALGRPVEAGEVPAEQALQGMHLPAGPLRDAMAAMFAAYNNYGFAGGNALVLRAILGREPRTLRQFIQELAQRP